MKGYYGGPTETHQRSFERYPPRPPMASLSPRLGVRNPNPKLQSLLSQELVKLYGLQIWPIHSQGPSEQKPMKNLAKSERGRIQGLAKFFEYPLLSQESVNLRTSNFARTFIGSIGTKAH